MNYKDVRLKQKRFIDDRNWDQFHSPDNLAKSISIEAGELLECFQWSAENFDKEAVLEELADVVLYAVQLADKLGVDLWQICDKKIDKNALKYPVNKAYGSAKKYDKLH